jgi:hypothetical protein
MAWEFAYRCDRCRRVQRVRTGDYRFYVVPWQGEGVELFDRVHSSDQEGWCRRCRRLRPMESIPDIALLERMKEVMAVAGLSPLDRKLAAEDSRGEQGELQRQLARIDEWIRWRKERRSPPKCFACGSTEVEPVNQAKSGGEGLRHPGCGGVFRICEDPCHIQPTMGFLVPAEGPEASRGVRRLWEWVRRRTRRCA